MKFDLDPFEYENGYNHTAEPSRLAKVLAHYELYKKILDIPGAIVECGVFKGSSLIRFAMMRELFETPDSRHIIGFDTFGKFPEANNVVDREHAKEFTEKAGDESMTLSELGESLGSRGLSGNMDLIKGDICETVADYQFNHPELRIALLHIDVDLYEPSKVILERFIPMMSKGGIVVLDDYGTFPGETKAVDEYFDGEDSPEIKKFPFSKRPSYFVIT